MIASITAVAFPIIGLASCPNPLDVVKLQHVKDKLGPIVTITSLAEGSSCAQMVIVTGRVADSSAALSGEVAFDAAGSFSFQFSTRHLSSSFVLRLITKDWSGNSGEKSLTLLKQSRNDITSFTEAPGKQQATLTWEAVPLAASCSLYYTTNGTLPSESYGARIDAVTSPQVVGGARKWLHAYIPPAGAFFRG